MDKDNNLLKVNKLKVSNLLQTQQLPKQMELKYQQKVKNIISSSMKTTSNGSNSMGKIQTQPQLTISSITKVVQSKPSLIQLLKKVP